MTFTNGLPNFLIHVWLDKSYEVHVSGQTAFKFRYLYLKETSWVVCDVELESVEFDIVNRGNLKPHVTVAALENFAL